MRSACAPRMPDLFSTLAMMLRTLVIFMLLAAMVPERAQAQLRGHGGPVRALAISPDGTQALSGSFDTSAIRWSLQRNAAEQVLRFHNGAVNAVAFLPDGRIATSGEDARIAIWRPGEPQPAAVLEGTPGAGGGACGVARWCDARLGVLGPHGRLWPLAGGVPRVLEGHHAERQRRRLHAGRQRAGERGLRRDAAHLAASDGGAPTVMTLPTPLNTVAVAPRRRDRRRRRRRQGLFLSAAGELRSEVEAARRRSSPSRSRPTAGSSPPRASAARSRSSTALAQARAHAGRTRPAGVVGGILPRRPHAPHRRHRPHDPPLGRSQRRADRQGGLGGPEDPLAAFAGDPGAEVFRACVACHTLERRRGATRRARPWPAFSAAGSRRCRATISPRRSSSSTSCGPRRRCRSCSRSGR